MIQKLSDAEVAQWTPGDGLLWVDLNLTNRRARKWLTEKSGIDGNVSSILLAEETRPRSLAIENGLVVIMRGINMNPGATPDDMVAGSAASNRPACRRAVGLRGGTPRCR